MRRVLILFLLAAVAAVCAADQEVTIAHKFKQGDIARYQADMSVKVGGQDVAAAQVVKYTVKEARPGGESVVAEENEPGELTIMGAKQPIQGGPAGTATLDSR